jgi:hypothetical protein
MATLTEDRDAITSVLQGYAYALDTRNPDALGQVFCVDVEAVYGDRGMLVGREAVVALLSAATADTAWMQHQVTVVHIAVDGDAATTLSYFTAYACGTQSPDVARVSVGEYRDELRRTESGWAIAKRNVHIGWRTQLRATSTPL